MKILLVEDDSRLCSRLRDDLSRRGYAVDVADNGVDAEHLGTEWLYDAVILDLPRIRPLLNSGMVKYLLIVCAVVGAVTSVDAVAATSGDCRDPG